MSADGLLITVSGDSVCGYWAQLWDEDELMIERWLMTRFRARRRAVRLLKQERRRRSTAYYWESS